MKTVLVIGSGGREHALAWKLSQSPLVSRLIVAPGNDGMPGEWERWPVDLGGGRAAFEELALKAYEEHVALTVVGPDNPLADGIVDVFEGAGLLCFGPREAAAQIEASKAFAKDVMQAAGVPTARYFVAQSNNEAQKILKSVPWDTGWVIKADGLALGKGVRVCLTQADALQAAEELISISGRLVIEERLVGQELSWMAICDGERCALLEPARDHKRLLDGDRGPNTGGMGAFSPVLGVDRELAAIVREKVFLPTLRELKKRGAEFRGLLYAGLMGDFSGGKFWVLEFNSRFGDPETQVLMPRIEGDLYPWLEASALGDLSALPAQVPFVAESAVVVVAAAAGYPEQPKKGAVIRGLGPIAGGESVPPVFFSGVRGEGAMLTVSGGRVLGAMGMGKDLADALFQAYQRMNQIRFEGMQFRQDIGGVE